MGARAFVEDLRPCGARHILCRDAEATRRVVEAYGRSQ
jgi:hypothetical protein